MVHFAIFAMYIKRIQFSSVPLSSFRSLYTGLCAHVKRDMYSELQSKSAKN